MRHMEAPAIPVDSKKESIALLSILRSFNKGSIGSLSIPRSAKKGSRGPFGSPLGFQEEIPILQDTTRKAFWAANEERKHCPSH